MTETNQSKKDSVLTLQQVLPACGVKGDEKVELSIDTLTSTTIVDIRLCDVPDLLSENVLEGRVSLISKSDTDENKLLLTVKVEC